MLSDAVLKEPLRFVPLAEPRIEVTYFQVGVWKIRRIVHHALQARGHFRELLPLRVVEREFQSIAALLGVILDRRLKDLLGVIDPITRQVERIKRIVDWSVILGIPKKGER